MGGFDSEQKLSRGTVNGFDEIKEDPSYRKVNTNRVGSGWGWCVTGSQVTQSLHESTD